MVEGIEILCRLYDTYNNHDIYERFLPSNRSSSILSDNLEGILVWGTVDEATDAMSFRESQLSGFSRINIY